MSFEGAVDSFGTAVVDWEVGEGASKMPWTLKSQRVVASLELLWSVGRFESFEQNTVARVSLFFHHPSEELGAPAPPLRLFGGGRSL